MFILSCYKKKYEELDYLQGKGTNSDFTRRINDEVNKARAHEEWKVEYMSLFLRDQEKIEEGEEAYVKEIQEELEEVGAKDN